MVAVRYLRSRRREGFISVIAWFSLLGIALGVGTLIVVMAVMNGFRQELLSRILGLNGHLSVLAQPAGIADYDVLAGRIIGLPGVIAVNPLVQGQVMITAAGQARGALVRGVRRHDIEERDLLADKITPGALDALERGEGVILGSRLAENLGVIAGDEVTLISPQGRTTALGTVPRVRRYKVAGTFQIGMYEYDSNILFAPLEAAQTFFQMPGRVSHLEVFLDDADKAPALAPRLAKALGPEYRIYDWQRANSGYFTALQVERNVMFLILTLIILVAAFNVISSMIMLVKDKGRDIAILRTMGATRGMILRIFLIAGASVGVIGTAVGFAGGVAFAANIETLRQWIGALTGTDLFSAEIYFLSQLPAEIDPLEVALVVAMALLLSFAATLYPSWRAARIDPAEALRYE
ncbi:MAG: lipoprotein-releasing ABC transporter permease subunit [Rhodospirillales bacterium]|nr:lipoprotein-releasing ABC transporter permease subunit [Rhodospirillales bacterium]